MDISEKTRSALKYYKKGNFNRAEFLCREIIEEKPDNIPILNLLGLMHAHSGDYDSAREYFKKALRYDPDNTEVYNNMGDVFFSDGQFDHAIFYYQKALQLNPDFAPGYFNVGLALQEKGQLDEAAAEYRKALRIDENFCEAYYNLGVIFSDKGLIDEAIQNYQMALHCNSEIPEAHHNLGNALKTKGKLDEAITCYRNAVKLNPHFTAAITNLGIALQDNGQLDEAIVCFQKVLQSNPDLIGAYNNLGNSFKDKGQFDEAIANFQKAIELNPGFAETYYNLGNIFNDKGQPNKAIVYYQKALQIDPGLAEAHWNMSLMLLSQGNYEEGWKKYEWRFLKKDARPSGFPQPRWDGRSLKGKKIIVSAEQGVGDEIMFASCLPDVIAQADLCIVECDNRLVPLFARSFPKAKVIEYINSGDAYPSGLPSADMRIALGSLPKFLRPAFSSFPQLSAYLEPDDRKVEVWRERLSELGTGLKTGISWRGGSKPAVKLARSIALAQWAKLFSHQGVHFINLQYGDCTSELREAREKLGITIHDWEDADPLKDLDGFAAQIAALDLVISVDNSTVHMSGALGVPVWTLLPYACDWRWMRDVEDTPWYKTVRLFRQSKLSDWNGVFKRIASKLKQYIKTGIMPEIRRPYKDLLKTESTVHQLATPATLSSSEKTYRCAVITPIGPGHEKLYDECLDSINRAFAKNKGIFSEIIPIGIDDTGGKLGRSKARNIAVRKAAEQDIEWIFFIDADDLMSPLAFEYVSPYLDNYDGIWGSIWPIEYGAQTVKERPGQLPFLYSIEDVLACDPFVTLGIGHFVKTSIAFSTPFDESLDAGEDFDYYFRVWEKYKCIKIPLPFWYHRRGSHSQGPRSATGREWRQQVESIIKKRYLRGWTTSFYYRGSEITFFISNSLDLIQQSHLKGHFFEIRELEFIAGIIPSQSVILEVGANIGNHAIFYEKFMDPRRIILIEPNPDSVRLLKKNMELNHCTKMETLLLGIGAGKNRGRFFVRDVQINNLGAAYLEANPAGDIEVAPLDELIHEKIDFIKIDVEKMELDVLEGTKKLIAAHHPDIFVEIMNENISDFEMFLKKIGYRISKKFSYVNAVNYFIIPN